MEALRRILIAWPVFFQVGGTCYAHAGADFGYASSEFIFGHFQLPPHFSFETSCFLFESGKEVKWVTHGKESYSPIQNSNFLLNALSTENKFANFSRVLHMHLLLGTTYPSLQQSLSSNLNIQSNSWNKTWNWGLPAKDLVWCQTDVRMMWDDVRLTSPGYFIW